MVFTLSVNLALPILQIAGVTIEKVNSAKLLGVHLSSNLTWNKHVEDIFKKCSQRLYLFYNLKRSGVNSNDLLKVYKCIVRPFEYACPVW